MLKSRVQTDTRASDLAALAASAAVPGLKARIRSFRSREGVSIRGGEPHTG